ncbi:MAG: quinolinate synthase NadA [Candidatus Omnitrophica bacterium]|nr:quinolinate synthase NadA [Candidatus Omnitrophota bacterium]
MKRITQEKILFALEDLKPEVYVADRIRKKAKKAIEAMFKIL